MNGWKNRAEMRKRFSDLVLTWISQNCVFITYVNQKLFRKIFGGGGRLERPLVSEALINSSLTLDSPGFQNLCLLHGHLFNFPI